MRRRYSLSLRHLYIVLNERFWGGQLPPPLRSNKRMNIPIADLPQFVMLRRVGVSLWGSIPRLHRSQPDGFCGGVFIPPGESWPAQIRVLSPLGAEQERRTLLHEMVHCGLRFAGVTEEGHGPRFIAELERLVAQGEDWALEQAAYYREHPQDMGVPVKAPKSKRRK